jgi:hypothetical protein
MNVGPSLKHDMFLCRFAPEPALPMCENSRLAASKRVTHLGLVAEITSRSKVTLRISSEVFNKYMYVTYTRTYLYPCSWL